MPLVVDSRDIEASVLATKENIAAQVPASGSGAVSQYGRGSRSLADLQARATAIGLTGANVKGRGA
jgi:hypothetical protein